MRLHGNDSPVTLPSNVDELRRFGILKPSQFSVDGVSRLYDKFAGVAGHRSRYMNFGLWDKQTISHQDASRNLLAELIAGLDHREGRILDVACGLGASAELLMEHWSPEQIMGINLTEAQVSVCKGVAPACHFVVMDATSLQFDDASFDNVICVEAAHHFFTREKFLREALRVLKPGGSLAMSDLLMREESISMGAIPAENYLPSIDAYRELLAKIGFSNIQISDISETGWKRYVRFEVEEAHEQWFRGEISFSHLRQRLSFAYSCVGLFLENILLFAQKGRP